MTINERIRYLRKEKLKLTQQEFSAALKISRSNIGNIETGEVSVTERVIYDICEKFNVNEDWLRTGAGGDENIYIPDDMRKYFNIGRSARNPSEFREFLSRVVELLPDEYCDYLYEEFKRFYEEHEKGNS